MLVTLIERFVGVTIILGVVSTILLGVIGFGVLIWAGPDASLIVLKLAGSACVVTAGLFLLSIFVLALKEAMDGRL